MIMRILQCIDNMIKGGEELRDLCKSENDGIGHSYWVGYITALNNLRMNILSSLVE